MPVCDFNPASEEYGDFIIHHNNSSPEDIILQQQAGCIDYVDQEFAIVYSLLEPLLPITTKNILIPPFPRSIPCSIPPAWKPPALSRPLSSQR